MENIEINLCPFCEGRDLDIDYDNYDDDAEDYKEYWIRCNACGLCGPIGLSEKQSMEFWNTLLVKKESEE